MLNSVVAADANLCAYVTGRTRASTSPTGMSYFLEIAVRVSADGLLLASGYNGFPRGVYDDVELLKDRNENGTLSTAPRSP